MLRPDEASVQLEKLFISIFLLCVRQFKLLPAMFSLPVRMAKIFIFLLFNWMEPIRPKY